MHEDMTHVHVASYGIGSLILYYLVCGCQSLHFVCVFELFMV